MMTDCQLYHRSKRGSTMDKNTLTHNMGKQISCSIVYSNLNKSDPWIYQKGKIMFCITFPYGEACDSEQYSIRSEVQETGNIREDKSVYRKNFTGIMG